ncbi:MAG: GrpB family protein [Elusimicrobiota bacterium]|jgi:GrpB-like predicted nucleotidyltransferase (UPF0157 family)
MNPEPLEARVQRLVREEVAIVSYDPRWPGLFEDEKAHLLSDLPADIVRRVEHFGSTAVPGLPAKPIIDILVSVSSLEQVKAVVVPILEAQGYEYLWRPTMGDDGPPWYAWFIKRDPGTKARTHHIHMVEASFTEHWDRLKFRDYLRTHPTAAKGYAELKRRLAAGHPKDRVAYTQGKTGFILETMRRAEAERGPAPSSG